MATLNRDAPEFHPKQLHNRFTISHHPVHYHRFTFFSFRQPNHFLYYYPTVTTPLPFSSSETKPTQVVNIFGESKPRLLEENQEEQKQEQEQEQEQLLEEKKEVVIREKIGCSKKVMQKQVFRILRNESRGPRGSNGLKFRRKKEEEPSENKYYEKRLVKNRQNVVLEQKNFRASSTFQKRAFPVVPVRPNGEETTVMIKNIPSKYTREMLVEFLENHCMYVNARDRESGEENTLAFDFVYLPIDFRTKMNKGYAFVNFTKPKAAWKFLMTASQRKWELFNSHKIKEVVLARIQGKENLKSHFEAMNFAYEYDDVLPISFSPPRDGEIKGDKKTLGRLFMGKHHL